METLELPKVSSQMSNTPAIYVACLAAYNNGYMHGKWIDANQSEDEILAEVQEMLKESPVTELYGEIAEEWAIHDYENFGGINLSECEELDRISTLAKNLEEHGEAYAAYVSIYDDDSIEGFEERYRGCYEDEEDFAYRLYEEMGTIDTLEKAGLNQCYIDFQAMARDLFISDYRSAIEGYNECHVFSDY